MTTGHLPLSRRLPLPDRGTPWHNRAEMSEIRNQSGRTPFDLIGGREPVRALVERFYDAMERTEPALTAVHKRDEQGRVSRESRDRFALFLVGWLGGPQDYMATHGHPRLRMRHGHVPIDSAMRDAWMRAMRIAMDERGIEGDLRAFLEPRFAELADFLRNTPDSKP